MKQLNNLVVDFFKETGYKHEYLEGTYYWYRARFNGETGDNVLYVGVDESIEMLKVFAVMDQKVPEAKRLIVSEFLTRLNYRLLCGSLQLDFSVGEVRMVYNVDTSICEITTAGINQIVKLVLYQLDLYSVQVMRIVYGDISAEAAWLRAMATNSSPSPSSTTTDDTSSKPLQ